MPVKRDLPLAQADFALNLLRELTPSNNTNTPSSLVVSPFSLATALSLAYAGAKGDTAEEIRRLIAGDEPNSSAIHEYYGGNSKSFSSESGSVRGGTRLWSHRAYVKEVLQGFKDTLDTYHAANSGRRVDFGDVEKAARVGNIVLQ